MTHVSSASTTCSRYAACLQRVRHDRMHELRERSRCRDLLQATQERFEHVLSVRVAWLRVRVRRELARVHTVRVFNTGNR